MKFRAKKDKYFVVQIAIGVLIIAIMFYFMMQGVGAYFTATANRHADNGFAVLNVNLLQNGSALTDSSLTQTQKLLPGSTLELKNISARNAGDANVYALIKLNIVVTSTSNEKYELTHWLNLTGDKVDLDNITVGATLINKGGNVNVTNLSAVLSGDKLGNSYMNATVSTTIAIYGIQSVLPESDTYPNPAVYASYLILTELAD